MQISNRNWFGARLVALAFLVPGTAAAGEPHKMVTWDEISRLETPPADHRIEYGADSALQFGELRLPQGAGPHPVVVLVHGGCWRNAYDYRHITPASAALTGAGFATWTLEFRRIGDPGGGWPGTFADVAAGTDYIRRMAGEFPVDASRVVLLGHSAGGHLVLWLAGRHKLPPHSPLRSLDPIPVKGVIALAAISDLRDYGRGEGNCNKAVGELLAGSGVANPYAHADPGALLPFGVPQILLHGLKDPTVPAEQSRAFARRARAVGDDSRDVLIRGAGHFDVIAPVSPAWTDVVRAVQSVAGNR